MMSTTVILCPKRKRPRLQSESWDARRADLPRNLLRTHNIPPMGAREWLGWATVENALAERVLSVMACGFQGTAPDTERLVMRPGDDTYAWVIWYGVGIIPCSVALQ